ncbi:hypothetical protein RUND412_000785 [Rhizina undulata]
MSTLLLLLCLPTALAIFLLFNFARPYLIFFYNCFLKPFQTKEVTAAGGQQDALESFYKGQAAVYDVTRSHLLRGREEMLALAAAQLRLRMERQPEKKKSVWVDIGGGTGWNIETMNKYLPVTEFFSEVYLVDFSPSLCAVAEKRFKKLGWKNVRVFCMDARFFKLGNDEKGEERKADWISMSYSLSVIPDFYSVVDPLSNLLSPTGLISVADFYVQSSIAFANRTYTGGVLSRHVNWFSRQFWRVWFEFDRVNLDEGRRDYLEYKFGTILSVNSRNQPLGGIPYYIWVGCSKSSTLDQSIAEAISTVDAAATESPTLLPVNYTPKSQSSTTQLEVRSKGYEAAVLNFSSNLPLPSAFYQNHIWRIYYDELLRKHTQFNNSYIYAFTWEDPRVDHQILKLNSEDVVLAITSAGDNILSYILDASPKRIHAVDLNPTQNHLLELKVAAFTALGYSDVWKIFGEGKNANFRELLIHKMSPHLSSRAFQYWLDNSHVFTSRSSNGLYETGQSRHAVKASKWLFRAFGLSGAVKKMCAATTINEQVEIWRKSVRPVILSRWVSWGIVGNERFLWSALGVPPNQRDMIYEDYHYRNLPQPPYSSDREWTPEKGDKGGKAMWDYVVDTFDPVIEKTLLRDDNYFYLLCLQGAYSEKCRPGYLTPKAHTKFSKKGAFGGLRIHTDEISEVVARLRAGTLTIAVVMDSMDWFDRDGVEARKQIKALNNAMKMGGRVMLRSAGSKPWYTAVFEEEGFVAKRVGNREPGTCIDRVNMYASTWICTKVRQVQPVEEAGEGVKELML